MGWSIFSPVGLCKFFIFAQNDHYLGNNGDLKGGKKWAGVGATTKKMGRCVRNARADFWSQSAPVWTGFVLSLIMYYKSIINMEEIV